MASKAWQTLQQSHREVDKLFADLHPPVFARQDWKGSVYARRTLGENVKVEAWYLAEHFLLAWNDWWGLCGRYLRYFGQPEDKLARSWYKLEAKCWSLAHGISRDPLLDSLIAHTWMSPPAAKKPPANGDRSAKDLFHAIVMNHRRFTFVLALTTRDYHTEDLEQPKSEAPVWPESSSTLQSLNDGLIREWEELPRTSREDTLWFLRNYQRANLAFSWLEQQSTNGHSDKRSAFMHALTEEKFMPPSIDQFVRQLNVPAEGRQLVGRVIERVQAAIAEVGYENFVDDVTAPEFLGGDDSAIGTSVINLVPGHSKSACFTTLLAVSRGESVL